MLPFVILHNSVSVDGHTTGFDVDMNTHYEIAGRFGTDAHLTGCDTLLAGDAELPPDGPGPYRPPTIDPDDERSLLVVVDSRGRLRKWGALRDMPYWREPKVALCSRRTPEDYVQYLEERYVECVVAGEDRVDMRVALEAVNERYGVGRVLLDSGGTLSGVLLGHGLVNQVSLLVHPCLVGGGGPSSIFREAASASADRPIGLELLAHQRLGDGLVWLHYDVQYG
jgi:2,5-diamino-6-(ribosylamino)-4(3H)-pyrimidinone 5'-phosphate reductase